MPRATGIPHLIVFLAVCWWVTVGTNVRKTGALEARAQCIWLQVRAFEI